jgi:Ca-activated chloride channel family protein
MTCPVATPVAAGPYSGGVVVMKSKSLMLVSAALLMSIPLLMGPLSAQDRKREAPDAPPFKLSTELVSLNVSVTDRQGQPISGLRREDFKLYENGVEQPLSFFSMEETPVCWGIVLDRSISMSDLMQEVYQAAVHVVDQGTALDETFVVAFNNRIELITSSVSGKNQLQSAILGLQAGGKTALWDAIDFALDHLKQTAHRKKVLVVVTDGKDNSSRIKFRDLIARARAENVLIYPVAMVESGDIFRAGARNYYPILRTTGADPRPNLKKLAKVTGARAHFTTDAEECREAMRGIAGEIGSQ